MPDWTSTVEIKRDHSVAVAFLWMSIGIALYDHVRFASFDWSILAGQRDRRWPQLFYFGAKLSWWGYIAVSVAISYTTTEINCQGMMDAVEIFMGLITTMCSALLACRTVCFWHGKARTIISVLLVILTTCLAAAWMVGVPDVTAVWVPGGSDDPWTSGACAVTDVPMQYSAKYIVTIFFDFIVFALTLVGVVRMKSTSRIGELLVQQGALYFIATFLVNAVITSLCLARLNPMMSLIAAVPSSCVSLLAATHLYVDLAEQALPSAAQRSGSGSGKRPLSTSAEKFVVMFGDSHHAISSSSGSNSKHAAFLKALEGGGRLAEMHYPGATGNQSGFLRMNAGSRGAAMSSLSHGTSGSGDLLEGANSELAHSPGERLQLRTTSNKPSRIFGASHSRESVELHRVVTLEPLSPHFSGSNFLSETFLRQLGNPATPASADPVPDAFPGLYRLDEATAAETAPTTDSQSQS